MTSVLEQRTRQLGEALQADDFVSAYLLIDPMLREPLDLDLIKSRGCEVIPVPVKHPSIQEDQRPQLVQLRPQDADVLSGSIEAALDEQLEPDRERAEGFSIGGWILSQESAAIIAKHLARVMDQCLVDGIGRKYMRWADRRVFEWMWPELKETQQDALLGPCIARYTLDRNGVIQVYKRESIEQASTKLTLTSAQWARATNCELAQEILRGWTQFRADLPEDYLEQAENAVTAAQSLGLKTETDIVLLAAYQLQIHPLLCRHPAIKSQVARALQNSLPLSDLLEEIPDPQGWDDIRKDLEVASPSYQSRAAIV